MKFGKFTPDSWTDLDAPNISTYIKSKTLAEKAAWDFVKRQKDDSPIEMVVMSPGVLIGATTRTKYYWPNHVCI